MNTLISRTDLRRLEQLLHEKRETVEAEIEKLLGRSEEECALALDEDVFSDKEEAMLAEMNPGLEADVARLRGLTTAQVLGLGPRDDKDAPSAAAPAQEA